MSPAPRPPFSEGVEALPLKSKRPRFSPRPVADRDSPIQRLQLGAGKIALERGLGELAPLNKGALVPTPDEIEALSRILRELNERFGTDFTEEDRVFIEQLEAKLAGDEALEASVRINAPENARLTFDHVVNDRLQEMMDSNFKFYKQITDDPEFAGEFLGWLFERYRRRADTH